eukprot:c53925_g1_i1.p1 GENE.c53925_g1_i1~~c53925_g1_i1.p1  ORF type:complete len:290 (-),score=59.30 c53925_g1_i1:70-939(-)
MLRVVVTGASGKTGLLLVQRLAQDPSVSVRAVVRSEAKAKVFANDKVEVRVADIVHGQPEELAAALEGQDSLVIVTSAIPKLVLSSLFGVITSRIFSSTPRSPSFYYEPNGDPYQVDWIGQQKQIDAAKQAGIKHVILVSSMGGTDENHFLNNMGNGNILLHKRKAELYLINSGLPYTIVHPGGLLPRYGDRGQYPAGQRRVMIGVDDTLLTTPGLPREIPRSDLVEVLVGCLREPTAVNRSFDLTSLPPGEGAPYQGDIAGLLAELEGKTCTYDKPDIDAALKRREDR